MLIWRCSVDLNQFHKSIKQTLENNLFNIINVSLNDERLLLISSLGAEFGDSATFFINKKSDSNNILIGANITFDTRILTKPTIDKIKSIASQYAIFCSPVKRNQNNISVITLQLNYEYAEYTEKEFMLYVGNFIACIRDLYKNIYKSIKLDGIIYLDLSMFSNSDLLNSLYDCIAIKNEKYEGSWDKYAEVAKYNGGQFELECINTCKDFEKANGLAIDLVCDFVIEMLSNNRSSKKLFN